MSKVCQITGKKTVTGNNVSHSNKKTKRTFAPNLKIKRFFVPEMNQWVVLKVSAAGLRTINKKGIYQAMKDAAEQGHLGDFFIEIKGNEQVIDEQKELQQSRW